MDQLTLLAEQPAPLAWTLNQIMGLSLWLGLAVLTLALMVLARTRWGQAKPLSKCVALSIFAHLLLGGYAYGTKLIFTVPVVAEPVVASLKMVELEPQEQPDEEVDESQPTEPWNQFAPVDLEDPAPQPDRVTGVQAAANQPTGFDSQPLEHQGAVPDTSQPPTAPRAEPNWSQIPANTASAAMAATSLHKPTPTPHEALTNTQEAWQPELPMLERPSSVITLPEVDTALLASDRQSLQEVFDSPTNNVSELVAGIDQLLQSTAFDAPRADVPRTAPESSFPPPAFDPRETDQAVELAVSQARNLRQLLQATPVRRRLGDGQVLPEVYQLRDQRHRAAMMLPLGGTPETELAVKRALAWLASVQEADGRWDASRFGAGEDTQVLGQAREAAGAEADTGITGLTILAFLAADHTHLEGEYQETVQRALEFLLGSQGADGNLCGKADFFAKMYCHGMATLALSESLAITGDPRLQSAVEAATRYTRQAQHPQTGGWRYQPHDRGDMSQFGWQVMALRSAEQAGIAIPESCRMGMHRFLDAVSSGTHGGLCAYREGESPSATMTAEGLTCRYFLDYQREEPVLREAAGMVLRGDGENSGLNLYYIYYATLAMYQRGGSDWDQWNQDMQRSLLPEQRQDERYLGSWDPDTRWGGYGGRVYSTAMATLSLEVYYRYLPLYRLDDPTTTRRDADREAAVRIPGDLRR